MANEAFRITFNKPAGKAYLEGMTGLRINIEGRTLRFRPVANYKNHGDAVEIVERGEEARRGGYEGRIEGKRAADILRLLQRLSTPRQPFFTLHKAPDGWLDIQHFNKDGNPPKFDPHVRLWPPREETSRQRRMRLASERETTMTVSASSDPSLAFAARILEAAKRISDYNQTRRIGRPPIEILDAQNVMAFFDNLVQQVRPNLAIEDRVDWGVLQQAHDLLGDLLDKKDAAPSVELPPPPTKARAALPAPEAPAPAPRGRPKSTAVTTAPAAKSGRRLLEIDEGDRTIDLEDTQLPEEEIRTRTRSAGGGRIGFGRRTQMETA